MRTRAENLGQSPPSGTAAWRSVDDDQQPRGSFSDGAAASERPCLSKNIGWYGSVVSACVGSHADVFGS